MSDMKAKETVALNKMYKDAVDGCPDCDSVIMCKFHTQVSLDLEQLQSGQAKLRKELDRRTKRGASFYGHVAPNAADVEKNKRFEPDGERLRAELNDWLAKNEIVSMMLDTDKHYVRIDINKLPDNIKPVLSIWGSIYVDNGDGSYIPPARAAAIAEEERCKTVVENTKAKREDSAL